MKKIIICSIGVISFSVLYVINMINLPIQESVGKIKELRYSIHETVSTTKNGQTTIEFRKRKYCAIIKINGDIREINLSEKKYSPLRINDNLVVKFKKERLTRVIRIISVKKNQ